MSFNNVTIGKPSGQGLRRHRRLEDGQASGRRHARRGDGRQRHAVRPGLRPRCSQPLLHLRRTQGASSAPTDTWDPPTAETQFQEALHRPPRDQLRTGPERRERHPIITYLKTLHIPAGTFPITGQDATLTGLENVLSGYSADGLQAHLPRGPGGSALALYLRAGKTPPSRGQRKHEGHHEPRWPVPSVSRDAGWVTRPSIEPRLKDKLRARRPNSARGIRGGLHGRGITRNGTPTRRFTCRAVFDHDPPPSTAERQSVARGFAP